MIDAVPYSTALTASSNARSGKKMAVLRNFVAIAALILQASFTVATFPHYNRQLSIPSWNYTASDSVQPTIVQTQVTAHNNTLTTASSTRSDSLITPTNQSTAAQSSLDPSGQSTLSSLSAIPSLPSTVAGTGQASISISITPSSISTAPSTQVSVPATSDIVVSSTAASQDFGQPSSQPTGPSSSVPIATSQASTQLGTELTGALSEPSVSTTITSLPTGARVETLTGIGFTEGTIITTTSSGSSDPTVVPVIVPASGPPKIVGYPFSRYLFDTHPSLDFTIARMERWLTCNHSAGAAFPAFLPIFRSRCPSSVSTYSDSKLVIVPQMMTMMIAAMVMMMVAMTMMMTKMTLTRRIQPILSPPKLGPPPLRLHAQRQSQQRTRASFAQ